MQLLVRTPQLHQLPVIVIALMRRRRERPPQRLHLRCMRTLSPRELNLRLRGRICHLGAPEPFRSGIVVECLAKLSLEILDVLRRLCSRIQGSARVAYLLSEWPSKSQPICNQRPCVAINLYCGEICMEMHSTPARTRNQDAIKTCKEMHTCPSSRCAVLSASSSDFFSSANRRRSDSIACSARRVCECARALREARAERHAQRGTRREAHAKARAERHTQRHSLRNHFVITS